MPFGKLPFCPGCRSAAFSSGAQIVAKFDVELDKPANGIPNPEKTDPDAVTFPGDSSLNLIEVRGKNRIPVPYQIETTDGRIIHRLIEPLQGKLNTIHSLITKYHSQTEHNKPTIHLTLQS